MNTIFYKFNSYDFILHSAVHLCVAGDI